MTQAVLLFNLSIPADARFIETVRDLAVRVAEYAGYGASEATEIARAVEGIAARAIHESDDGPVDVRFRREAGMLEVSLFYSRELAHNAAEPLRPSMDRVEFGRDGSRHFCRMTRELPG